MAEVKKKSRMEQRLERLESLGYNREVIDAYPNLLKPRKRELTKREQVLQAEGIKKESAWFLSHEALAIVARERGDD